MEELISQITNLYTEFLSEKTAQNKESIIGSLFSFAGKIDFRFENKINSLLRSSENSFYFSSRENQFSFIAIDQALNFTENGQARFISADKKIKEIEKKLIKNWEAVGLPLFVGAMKFNVEHPDDDWKDFPDSSWFVPELIICKNKENTFLLYNYYAEQGLSKIKLTEKFKKRLENLLHIKEDEIVGSPRIVNSIGLSPKDKKKWKQIITQVLEKINNNELKKAVLSRKIELTITDEINFTRTINCLKEDYPNCYLFAYHRGKSTFFGATPELLAKFSDGRIETDVIAGSISRGKNEVEDAKLESYLLNNKKDLDEHHYVLEHAVNAFKLLGINIDFEKTPSIKKLKNIQHLSTKIISEVKNNLSIMSVLKELHPTPAVCGFPKEQALSLIKKIENQRRGLYSGIIGWFNLNNEGEFAVAIRSAVTRGNKVTAYAGGGIVEGSEADAEFEETEMKLKPILSLFSEQPAENAKKD